MYVSKFFDLFMEIYNIKILSYKVCIVFEVCDFLCVEGYLFIYEY